MGGEFVVFPYELFVDFGTCDGVVEIIWHGKTDFHATMLSRTIPGFIRLRTSIQINRKLIDRIAKLVKKHKMGVDINRKVRGVKKIIDEKLHTLK